MITVNEEIMKQEAFGDNTLKCVAPRFSNDSKDTVNIKWCYDNDAELFCLWSIVRHIQEQYPDVQLTLTMPYIPHARQDRNVSGRLFTLKYFAEQINAMRFKRVYVLDPHSDVSIALLDRVEEIDLPIIVDAGIGKPSQACEAMELGVSAIMANTAVATAGNIKQMAKAFKLAIEAGRLAYLSGPGRVLDTAEASSPLTGFLQD